MAKKWEELLERAMADAGELSGSYNINGKNLTTNEQKAAYHFGEQARYGKNTLSDLAKGVKEEDYPTRYKLGTNPLFQEAYNTWIQEEYYPQLRKEGKTAKGDLKLSQYDWNKSLDNKISSYKEKSKNLGGGASEEFEKYLKKKGDLEATKQDFFSNFTSQLSAKEGLQSKIDDIIDKGGSYNDVQEALKGAEGITDLDISDIQSKAQTYQSDLETKYKTGDTTGDDWMDINPTEEAATATAAEAAATAAEETRQGQITGEQDAITSYLDSAGATPEYMKGIREELSAKPEMEDMSPEFRQYMDATLQGIDEATRKTIKMQEERAAKGGLSPYAGKAITEELRRGEIQRTMTGAELALGDYQQRLGDLRNKESMRLGFLQNEYGSLQGFNQQMAELKQRREWETEDDYKNRMRFLEDELRQRGYSQEDIASSRDWEERMNREGRLYASGETASARAAAEEGQYRQRGWAVADEMKRRQQALEDYEKQKQDYFTMLKMTKTKDTPWWQKALGAVAGGVGTALGGAAGGAIAGGVTSLFGGGKAPSQQQVGGGFPSIGNSYIPTTQQYGGYQPQWNNTQDLYGKMKGTNTLTSNPFGRRIP